jgi:hypothetical protein
MPDALAVRLTEVGKMYRIYPTRLDSVLGALGFSRLMPWRRVASQEFWALRDVSLELKPGSRLGISADHPTALGTACFYLHALFPEAAYTLHFRYRCHRLSGLSVQVFHNGIQAGGTTALPSSATGWTEWSLPLDLRAQSSPNGDRRSALLRRTS